MKNYLLLTLLLSVIGLGSGCQSFRQALHQERFETSPARATRFAIKVVNDSTVELALFEHEARVLAIVPAHEVKTIYVNLEYYDQNFKVVMFAKPITMAMGGKYIPRQTFYFRNYRYDSVYGSGWGAPENEIYVWGINDNTFKQLGWSW